MLYEEYCYAVWIACAVDTDGHVGIKAQSVQKGRYVYYLPRIGFGNSHRGIVEHFGKIIGVTPPPTTPDKMNRVLLCNTKKVKKILEFIIPHLIVKKERAEYVLAYCNHRLSKPGDHGPGESPRHREDKEWYNEYRDTFIKRE